MDYDLVSSRLTALYGHHSWLQQWLVGHVSCRETAEDLVQDTYLRVLRNQRRVPETISEPRAYLRCIARGLVINHWRRCDLERALFEALAAMPETVAPSAETLHIMLETLYELDGALAGLPDEVRQAFFLARFERLPYSAIAARMGYAEITIKRYVRRALVHCAQTMESIDA